MREQRRKEHISTEYSTRKIRKRRSKTTTEAEIALVTFYDEHAKDTTGLSDDGMCEKGQVDWPMVSLRRPFVGLILPRFERVPKAEID